MEAKTAILRNFAYRPAFHSTGTAASASLLLLLLWLGLGMMILLFSWVMDVKAGRFFDGSWSSSGGDDDDDECDDASSSLSLSRHPVATVGGVGGVGGMTAYLFVRLFVRSFVTDSTSLLHTFGTLWSGFCFVRCTYCGRGREI